MEKKVYKLLKERYHYDLDSEWFTDEMLCVIDDTIKVVTELLQPKKKPLEERKVKFKVNVLKFPDYGEIMLDEFIDYWSEHNDNGKKMKFEMQKTFNIDLRLKQWQKRSNQYQTKSNGVNQDWA